MSPYLSEFGSGPLSFSVRQGDTNAIEKSLAIIENQKEDLDDGLTYIKPLGELKISKSIPVFLKIVEDN
ncbi:MAG: hypothetical protein QM485_11965 [Flavobacteriaceae bacterium]